MPMYAYSCTECSAEFDKLRRMDQSDADVVCPHCGSVHVQRRLAVFAAHTRTEQGTVAPVATGGGGCCSGGACGCASRN
jgi:putative FmdB family regulatory protein